MPEREDARRHECEDRGEGFGEIQTEAYASRQSQMYANVLEQMGLVPRYPLQKPPSRGLEGSGGEGGVFLLKVQYSVLKSLISTCVLSYVGSR